MRTLLEAAACERPPRVLPPRARPAAAHAGGLEQVHELRARREAVAHGLEELAVLVRPGRPEGVRRRAHGHDELVVTAGGQRAAEPTPRASGATLCDGEAS